MGEKMSELSYVKGAREPVLREQTIGAALEAAAAQWGERDALVSVHQNIRWSFAELNEMADAFAAGLLALGLNPGDRLGIWSPNNAQWALAQFATAKAGIILVNINPAYRLSELEYTLNKVGVSALITPERFKTSEYVAMVETLAPEICESKDSLEAAKLPALKHVIQIGGRARPGWRSFDDVAALAGSAEKQSLTKISAGLDCRDAINIQFTSGTTGLPKGATLSHHNILNNGFFVGEAVGLAPGDRLCIPVPLYHCFGMVMGNLGCLTHGATMVYPGDGFEPEAVLQAVQDEKCTALYGVPTMFIAELGVSNFDRFDLSSLRMGCMAGSPCPVEVMNQVISRMNMRDVTIAYGMTETSPVSFQSGQDDPLERRVSTIGQVQPHLECKVVDADGNSVPRGETGELCTRGYAVMLGYWDDKERTDEAIDSDGWMHTGDLATIDAEGYGNIVGRLKDMVIRGGENVYPREIEEFFYRHPKVEDVSVVGVPDDKFGEEICVWIILRSGELMSEEEVKAFCQGQIAHYKVPRHIRFVTEFPMTVTGKVQKFEVREKMIEELKLAEVKTV